MKTCAPTWQIANAKLCLLVTLLFAAAITRAEDPLTKSLGINKSEALPIWEKPTRQAIADLSDQFKNLNASVCLVGTNKNGAGTGFVISKKHRLIATNAHCADIRYPYGDLYVMSNNSPTIYEVDKVWYHPGVSRFHKTGVIRSVDPAQGKVYTHGPDVAVLHVGGDAELPDEIPLATASEFKNVFAKPVGMIGYPGHDTEGWPKPGESPSVTAREGIIARATDFNLVGAADDPDKQFLQHTMASWYGFSGSPIFLSNGHVIALNNSGRTVRGNADTSIAFGIRVDCLWELLAYHHLTDKVPVPVDEKELRLARFEKDDPRLVQLNQVIELVAKGDLQLRDEKFSRAEATLKKALKIMPNYAEAHSKMGLVHNNVAILVIWKSIIDGSDKYTESDYKARLQLALKESQKALELDPTNVDYLLDASRVKCAVIFAEAENNSDKDVDEAKVIAKKLIDLPEITQEQRAFAWQLYGIAHAKEIDRIPFYKKALEVMPHSITFAGDLARAYRNLSEDALAIEYEQKLEKLTAAQKSEDQMWEMSTSPDDTKRNGAEALRLAKEACEATNYTYWWYLECLAAAQAELKNFDTAQIWQAKAFIFVPDIYRSGAKKRLKLYLDNKPFREAE